MTEQIEFEDNDYIGCDYYGFAYESLVYSHAAQFTATNGRTTYQPGTLVIVCARADDPISTLTWLLPKVLTSTRLQLTSTQMPNPTLSID